VPPRPARAPRQVGAVCAVALAAAAIVVLAGSQRSLRAGLEQLPAASTASKGGSDGGSAGVADAAEREISTIGRDALKMWGAWDGLSPVATQMMAQVPPAHPGASAAAAQKQGVRGRIRERLQHAERDGRRAGLASARHPAASMPRDDGPRSQSLTAGVSLKHAEREAAPFPYVTAELSLHGVRQALGEEQLLDLKRSIAEAVELDRYGSASMEAVLGEHSWEWIVVQSQKPLNCSAAPHMCDDKGRRRRLLSVEEPRDARPRARRGRSGTWERQQEKARRQEHLDADLVDAEVC